MRISTYVYGQDAVVEEGVTALLRRSSSLEILGQGRLDEASVAVVAVDEPDEEALRVIRALQRTGGPSVVLVVGRCDEGQALEAVEAGICGLVRRCDVTEERLSAAVTAAASGGGSLPPDVLGRLMRQFGGLHRSLGDRVGLMADLDDREIVVLKLVAEGHDTKQIADELAYSERTIKGIVQEITRRLGLKNRSHAVAYAVRHGLI